MPISHFENYSINMRTCFHHEDEEPIRTKIVATLGAPEKYREQAAEGKFVFDLNAQKIDPTALTYEGLVHQFYDNGVDVLRMNFSHLGTKGAEEVFPLVKRAVLARENRDRPSLLQDPRCWNPKRIAVLADLPGPKIRFHFEEPLALENGSELAVAFDPSIQEGAFPVYVDKVPLRHAMDSEAYSDLMQMIHQRVGQEVLVFVGDGDAILQVRPDFDPNKPLLPCTVLSIAKPGRSIKGRKGFTLKGIDLAIPTFTRQDRAILETLLEKEYAGFGEPAWVPVLAFVALSFVQTPTAILRARRAMERQIARHSGMRPQQARLLAPAIIAKIETGRGVENRDSILDVADGAMVARGDLGLQLNIEEVPAVQKRLIRLCNERGKPVITATQMLASMTESVEPTRAEVTDVFNAIQDGTDAVMTSEETAIGSYPFHTLRKMISIAEEAERFFEHRRRESDLRRKKRREQRIKDLRRQRYREFLRNDSTRIHENERRLTEEHNRLSQRIEGLRQINRSPEQEDELEWLTWCQGLYDEKVGKATDQETTNRITEAACTMAEAEKARVILAATTSGRTVRMIARIRPRVIIVGAAHDEINTRKLLISYGVIPIFIGAQPANAGTEAIFTACGEVIRYHGFLDRHLTKGQQVIFTAGFPLQSPGTTNLVQIRELA